MKNFRFLFVYDMMMVECSWSDSQISSRFKIPRLSVFHIVEIIGPYYNMLMYFKEYFSLWSMLITVVLFNIL